MYSRCSARTVNFAKFLRNFDETFFPAHIYATKMQAWLLTTVGGSGS
jgi:hypothetical protein